MKIPARNPIKELSGRFKSCIPSFSMKRNHLRRSNNSGSLSNLHDSKFKEAHDLHNQIMISKRGYWLSRNNDNCNETVNY